MEIDGEVAKSAEAAGGNVLQVNSAGAELREDGERPRDAKHGIMNWTRLSRSDGKGGPKAF